MQIHYSAKVRERIVVRVNKTQGILNYDIDNSYPQRMLAAVANSGIATTCIRWYRKFIEGHGFVDEQFASAVINRKGMTMNQLLYLQALNYARLQGFAFHVNYDANFQIAEVNYQPFQDCRLTVPDSEEYVGKIAVYRDWARLTGRNINKRDINLIDVFNSDPEVIQAQVERVGSLQQYKGQILWVSAEYNAYPLAIYDSVLEDIETDSGVKIFKNRGVIKGFKAQHLFVYKGKFENDTDREQFDEKIEEFTGAENSSTMLVVEAEKEEEIPEIKEIKAPRNDKLFEHTEKSIEENIRQQFLIPEVFIRSTPGKLGQDNSLKDAEKFYNALFQ